MEYTSVIESATQENALLALKVTQMTLFVLAAKQLWRHLLDVELSCQIVHIHVLELLEEKQIVAIRLCRMNAILLTFHVLIVRRLSLNHANVAKSKE